MSLPASIQAHQQQRTQRDRNPDQLHSRHHLLPQECADDDGDDHGEAERHQRRSDIQNGQRPGPQQHGGDERHPAHHADEEDLGVEAKPVAENEHRTQHQRDDEVVGDDDDGRVVTAALGPFEQLAESER